MRQFWIPAKPQGLAPNQCGRQTIEGRPCEITVKHPGEACHIHVNSPRFANKVNSESPWPQPAHVDSSMGLLLAAGIPLTDVDLSNHNLLGANLASCPMRGADLRGTVLSRANLRGTDLTDCKTDERTLFDGAVYDSDTRWPDDSDHWPPSQAKPVSGAPAPSMVAGVAAL